MSIRYELEPFQTSGQAKRALLGRKIAFGCSSSVFDILDFDDDILFRSPVLFSSVLCDDPRATLLDHLTDPRGLTALNSRLAEWTNAHGKLALVDRTYPNVDRVLPPDAALDDWGRQEVKLCQKMIELQSPALLDLLLRSLKFVLIFSSPGANSFASDPFPGFAFINRYHLCSPISLLEDLTHQAMHCVYADVEMSDLWTYSIDPGMTISDFYSGPSSDRTLSVLVHSILTEIASLEALSDQYQTGSLNSVEQLEAIARIGFIIRKFQIDVCYANYIPMLDGEAREVFCRITSFGAKLADSMNDHTKDFSYLSQEYNFSMPAFIRDNPFQWSDRRSGSGNYPTTRPIASPTAPTI